ncbi:MAG: flagellar basal body-associated FliL family protein [Gammaproteobacteria bacterium]|nr:flagellar basal body-associated FliL family protein [Gammaproteobacteria bacterium]
MRRSIAISLLTLVTALTTVPLCSAAEEEEEAAKTPHYFELKPSIVANMQKGAQYIRCDVQLLTMNAPDHEAVGRHAPALRHEMFLLLSDQEGTQLKETKGKEKFRKDALSAMKKVMQKLSGRDMPEDLYFTSFYVQ